MIEAYIYGDKASLEKRPERKSFITDVKYEGYLKLFEQSLFPIEERFEVGDEVYYDFGTTEPNTNGIALVYEVGDLNLVLSKHPNTRISQEYCTNFQEGEKAKLTFDLDGQSIGTSYENAECVMGIEDIIYQVQQGHIKAIAEKI